MEFDGNQTPNLSYLRRWSNHSATSAVRDECGWLRGREWQARDGDIGNGNSNKMRNGNGNEVAGDKEGDGESGKSNGNGNKEGNGDGGKVDGNGNKEGKGQW